MKRMAGSLAGAGITLTDAESSLVEPVARVLCIAQGTDPDRLGYPIAPATIARLGKEPYPLWKYQIPSAEAVIQFLRKG